MIAAPLRAQTQETMGRLSSRTRKDTTLAMPVPLSQTTGRRKQAVARVRFRPGQGFLLRPAGLGFMAQRLYSCDA